MYATVTLVNTGDGPPLGVVSITRYCTHLCPSWICGIGSPERVYHESRPSGPLHRACSRRFRVAAERSWILTPVPWGVSAFQDNDL